MRALGQGMLGMLGLGLRDSAKLGVGFLTLFDANIDFRVPTPYSYLGWGCEVVLCLRVGVGSRRDERHEERNWKLVGIRVRAGVRALGQGMSLSISYRCSGGCEMLHHGEPQV